MSAASVLRLRRWCGAIFTVSTVTLTLVLSLVGACVPACAWQAAPAAPVIEETFVLKHLKPSALVTFLAQSDTKARPANTGTTPPRSTSVFLTDSIKSVTTDDVFNTVTVQGAPDAIAAIRKVATLLDVPPQPVRLTVRIIRYRSAPKAKGAPIGPAVLPDVEEVASGVVETPSNIPAELSTYGDRHLFRARLIPHINNAGSVSIAADLQMVGPDGTFAPFPMDPSGTRLLRIGDRGLITSVGAGIGSSKVSGGAKPSPVEKPKTPEQPSPETYYLEVTPSFPPPAEAGKTEPPAARPQK